MTLDEFWGHIEAVKQTSAKLADLPGLLAQRLGQLPEGEIVDFSRHFHDCVERADNGCLWAAAIVIRDECSDDSFDYFIGWLIGQGRKVFEAALADPDSLANLERFDGDSGEVQLENILAVDVDAYMARTGSEDFEILRTRPRSGTRNSDFLMFSDEEMRELYPKLAARFPGYSAREKAGGP